MCYWTEYKPTGDIWGFLLFCCTNVANKAFVLLLSFIATVPAGEETTSLPLGNKLVPAIIVSLLFKEIACFI